MTIKRRFIMILVAAAIAVSLNGQDSPSSSSDVVSSFRQYIRDYMASFKTDGRERVFFVEGQGWRKMTYAPKGDPSIDVRKTDSLISPYLGTCEFTLVGSATAFHPTEAQARTDTTMNEVTANDHRHSYAFQDGHWVVKKREAKMFNDWYSCDQCNTNTGKYLGDIHGCWEQDTKNLTSCSN